MNKSLFLTAVIKYISGVILVGLLLFVPAGTLNYWNDQDDDLYLQ